MQENPWQAIGIAAGVGLLIGLLANRRQAPLWRMTPTAPPGQAPGRRRAGPAAQPHRTVRHRIAGAKGRTWSLLFAGLALVFAPLLLTALSGLLLLLGQLSPGRYHRPVRVLWHGRAVLRLCLTAVVFDESSPFGATLEELKDRSACCHEPARPAKHA